MSAPTADHAASAFSLIRSISFDACTCPDGLLGICPVCRCRAFLGTPAVAQPARARLPQPDEDPCE